MHAQNFFPVDPLGYDLALQYAPTSEFFSKLQTFCWILRSLDEIDGTISIEHVDSADLHDEKVLKALRQYEARGGRRPPCKTKLSGEELWPPRDEEMIGYYGEEFRAREDPAKFNWNKLVDLEPRDVQMWWQSIMLEVIDTWPQECDKDPAWERSDHQSQSPIDQARQQEKMCQYYVRSVQQWVSRILIPGGEPPSLTQLPPFPSLSDNMRFHLAHLCALFNRGPLVKLAVLAEQDEMVFQMLRLYDAFKLISAVLHQPGTGPMASPTRRLLLSGFLETTESKSKGQSQGQGGMMWPFFTAEEVELMVTSHRRLGAHREFDPPPEQRRPVIFLKSPMMTPRGLGGFKTAPTIVI